MKAIMVLFDSLKKDWLPPYGGDIIAPNFERLAGHTVAFDRFYVGSLPCMPARRELHTGRYNFLHEGWSPLEPFDDSMPQILRDAGVHSHLVSDHLHYWREGGGNYAGRYTTYEHIRGQEGDAWKGVVDAALVNTTMADTLPAFFRRMFIQDTVNRMYMATEDKHSQTLTFNAGLEFVQTNAGADNWFLQLECFDPHEPFFTYDEYRKLYPSKYEGRHVDWPMVGTANQDEDYVAYVQNQYKALVSMADKNLGRLLDMMDENDLWKDTLLIVNADHGLLLGEHEWWSKGAMPAYNEIANIPFFIWDPRAGIRGEHRQALAQNIDVAATVVDFFGLPVPPDMQGRPLLPAVQDDTPLHDTVMFGYHGGMANITDGRYVYMRGPATRENAPLYEYTLIPARMGARADVGELQNLELAPPFAFTKGCRTLKIDMTGHGAPFGNMYRFGTRLYDLQSDPGQRAPLDDADTELRLIADMIGWMRNTDAPPEQYTRLGLWDNMTKDDLCAQRAAYDSSFEPAVLPQYTWTPQTVNMYLTMVSLAHGEDFSAALDGYLTAMGLQAVTPAALYGFVGEMMPKAQAGGMMMMLRLSQRLD